MEHQNDVVEKIRSYKIDAPKQDLDVLFSTLGPIAINTLTGEWRLEYLFTRESLGKLEKLVHRFPIFRLYGKRFINKDNVRAWVYSIFGMKFEIPFTTAVLRPLDYNGIVSTAMIYDRFPIIDRFRKIDDNTIMGSCFGKVR